MNAAARPNSALAYEDERAAARVGAIARLASVRPKHADLRRAEAAARLDLAAAIIALDAVGERIAAGEQIHDMNEQAEVELASRAYSRALADLLRGMADSWVETEEPPLGDPSGAPTATGAHVAGASERGEATR